MGKKKNDFSAFMQSNKNKGFLNMDSSKGKSVQKTSNSFSSQNHKSVNLKRGQGK